MYKPVPRFWTFTPCGRPAGAIGSPPRSPLAGLASSGGGAPGKGSRDGEHHSAAAGAAGDRREETGEKGLKKDAIGFLDGLSIGLASTAPAYSLAAVIGSIVVAVGIHAPGVLLLSFVPMFFIAAAFYYMNRVDTDCGTTFSWVTRAMGPYWGFMGGWAICTTGILVVGSLADVSAYYTYDLLGSTAATASRSTRTSSRSRRWPWRSSP